MANQNIVPKLYRTVVDDVINGVREAFLDESVDEQVLQELKQLWESKLQQSKSVETVSQDDPLIQQYKQHQSNFQQQQQQKQQQLQQTQQRQAIQVTQVQPTQAAQIQATQIPQMIQAQRTLQLSSAAQAAAGALPTGLYQQQLQLPTGMYITIGPDGTQQLVVPAQSSVLPQQGLGTTYTVAAAPQLTTAQVTTTDARAQNVGGIVQLDGANDSSSEEEEDDEKDDDDDENDEEQNEEDGEGQGEEEEPLNSDDDVSDEDPADLFDTDNVIVCQYDKIHRSKNKWKFHLKDGIMNLNGRDYVFQKANGDAEW